MTGVQTCALPISANVDVFSIVLTAASLDSSLGAALRPRIATIKLGTEEAKEAQANWKSMVEDRRRPEKPSPLPVTQRISSILADGQAEVFWRLFNLVHRSGQVKDPDALLPRLTD